MRAATYAAKTAFMSTVVIMKEAQNAANMMENESGEMRLCYQQLKNYQVVQKEHEAVSLEQQRVCG